mmetsp:Transcript_34567/g.107378  ORF Transcript_34567/g.107378 Transcript_34567/m.107378 type:complete len:258 (-) Transcript_34567:368-1141(-)
MQGLIHLDDVGVRRQVREDADLRADGEDLAHVLHAVLANELQGSRTVLRVLRFEDGPETPRTQHLPQGVAAHAAGDPDILLQRRVLQGDALQYSARQVPEALLADRRLQDAKKPALHASLLPGDGRAGPARQALRPHVCHLHRAGRHLLALAQNHDITGAILEQGRDQLELLLLVLVRAEEDHQDGPIEMFQGSHARQSGLGKHAQVEDQHHVGAASVLIEHPGERIARAHPHELHLVELLAFSLGLREEDVGLAIP